MQNRTSELEQWLQQLLEKTSMQLTPLRGDASFRRYFRLTLPEDISYIIMDAPPPQESLASFLTIADALTRHGIRAPRILQKSVQNGFAILEDFGDTLLLDVLTRQSPDDLYQKAFHLLHHFQRLDPSTIDLPPFNAQHMMLELSLFKDWFLEAYLKIHLTTQDINTLHVAFTYIIEEIAAQPIVPIHRDFHARNLMLLPDNSLGVIDFQDAMMGPMAYDLVSLLKDCYVQWPLSRIHEWTMQFYEQSPIAQTLSAAAFKKAFDWCGIQRHLKVLGIFARLYLRDNKPGYLQDIPLTLKHLTTALVQYPELSPLNHLIERHCRIYA